ncbi:VCBS repeat-containing protein [Streptomyces coelicoflavus]|uniref:FG-GAP repeat domain-containing protein n=1 Tax=Streptomyces coelicoflavus TaxID=285562 RepID=UPI0024AD17BD|nr:VCBS repeat-containing protein [Streptomyces coelicoflavus]MDI6517058.1 VCBS repeat-containing protein [Streptomyces coelicoflavus]
MAKSSGLNTRRALARATAAALTAALVATGASSAVASDAPVPSASKAPLDVKSSDASKFGTADVQGAPFNGLYGMTSGGDLYSYGLDGYGGLTSRSSSGWISPDTKFVTQVDHNADGESDGNWLVVDGELRYLKWDTTGSTLIGKGWGIYDRLLSAGNLGGAGADDLIARDTSGVLWLYLGYGNGTLTKRYRVGGGWNAYTHLAGKGDLTGDGKDDIVAKDKSGVLWLYKGTGNYKAPFTSRTRIGGGWNTYNNLVTVGDIDYDDITDLIARNTNGALYLYKGTGNAAAPYKSPVKIGSGGWNTYRILF